MKNMKWGNSSDGTPSCQEKRIQASKMFDACVSVWRKLYTEQLKIASHFKHEDDDGYDDDNDDDELSSALCFVFRSRFYHHIRVIRLLSSFGSHASCLRMTCDDNMCDARASVPCGFVLNRYYTRCQPVHISHPTTQSIATYAFIVLLQLISLTQPLGHSATMWQSIWAPMK